MASIVEKVEYAQQKSGKREPQYLTSPTGIRVMNYRVYYFNFFEIIIYTLLALVAGAFVGYLFFGNLAYDSYGQPTQMTHILNLAIPAAFGVFAVILFLPMRRKGLMKKRQAALARQFRDLLDGLTTSLGAGSNTNQAFYSVYDDLKLQYDDEDFIVKEVQVILIGIENNFAIEDLIRDLGNRSANDDITSFGNVFAASYRKGGNLASIMETTHEVLSTKMQIAQEIETTMASSKASLYTMLVMPIMIVSMLKFTGGDMAKMYGTPAGIFASIAAIVIFVVAFMIGKRVMDVKI